jgi:thymidine phosphorylase
LFCIDLAVEMVSLGKKISKRLAKKEVLEALISGKAYQKFEKMITSQGGDLKSLKVSLKRQYILSIKAGKLKNIDALKFGELSMKLGAGRIKKEDNIDHSVGIVLNKQVGDKIKIGDLLCTLYLKDNNVTEDITKYFDIR